LICSHHVHFYNEFLKQISCKIFYSAKFLLKSMGAPCQKVLKTRTLFKVVQCPQLLLEHSQMFLNQFNIFQLAVICLYCQAQSKPLQHQDLPLQQTDRPLQRPWIILKTTTNWGLFFTKTFYLSDPFFQFYISRLFHTALLFSSFVDCLHKFDYMMLLDGL
jgi:hypothetical protein